VGRDCGRIVLQYPHDCPMAEPRGAGRGQNRLAALASIGLVPGRLVECGRGPVGAGVEAAGFWLCAQPLVLQSDCLVVAGNL
jgi:hypothetical protein